MWGEEVRMGAGRAVAVTMAHGRVRGALSVVAMWRACDSVPSSQLLPSRACHVASHWHCPAIADRALHARAGGPLALASTEP